MNEFNVTDDEYEQIEAQLGQLVHFAAWQFLYGNVENNHTETEEDLAQEFRIALVTAGTYIKRQRYVEAAFETLPPSDTLNALRDRWENRRRHGGCHSKFGQPEIETLDELLRDVPRSRRPKKNAPLVVDSQFISYAKSVMWNSTKASGRKVSREKPVRVGLVSLSGEGTLQSYNFAV